MRLVSVLSALLLLWTPAWAGLPAEPSQRLCGAESSTGAVRVIATSLAGVPARIRMPARMYAPPVVLWHGFGPPAGEAALEALLPLDEVPAIKVYLGLPLSGARAPADPPSCRAASRKTWRRRCSSRW